MKKLPYLQEETIEKEAVAVLCEALGEEVAYVPQVVDVDRIAELYLGANVDYHCLSLDGSTLGLTVFQKGFVEIYPHEDESSVGLECVEGTILLDLNSYLEDPEYRTRFTLAHECGHLYLHADYFGSLKKYDDKAIVSAHRQEDLDDLRKQEEMFTRSAEWQANRFGAALLMPKPAFRESFQELAPKGFTPFAKDEKIQVVSSLADAFGTSPQATAIRIKTLRLVA